MSDDTTTFTEEDVLLTLRRNRWLSLSVGGRQVLQMNWVVSLIASSLLWGFVICLFFRRRLHVHDLLRDRPHVGDAELHVAVRGQRSCCCG